MIKFNEVSMKNFMSFGNKEETVKLDTNETVLVVGNNKDIGEEGSSKNGVGKSSSMQAVVYALFGQAINALKQDEMINLTNEKKMHVTLKFTKNGESYEITRGRKPNILSFHKGKEDLTKSTMKNTDKEIIDVLGMSKDTFLMSFLMSNSVTPFMEMKPAEQRQFMEDVLGLTMLTERATTLKSLKKDCQTEITVAQSEFNNASRDNDSITLEVERSYEEAEKFEREHEQKVKELQDFIDQYKDKDFDDIRERFQSLLNDYKHLAQEDRNLDGDIAHQREIKVEALGEVKSIEAEKRSRYDTVRQLEERSARLAEDIDQYNKELLRANDELKRAQKKNPLYHEMVALLEQHEEASNHISKAEKKVSDIEKDTKKITGEITHLEDNNCPYCKQHYNTEESQQKLSGLKDQLKENDKTTGELNLEITQHKDLIVELDEKLEAFPDDVAEYDDRTLKNAEKEQNRLNELLEKVKSDRAMLGRQFSDGYTADDIERLMDEAEPFQDIADTADAAIKGYEIKRKAILNKYEKVKADLIKIQEEGFKTPEEIDRTIEIIEESKSEMANKKQEKNHFLETAERFKAKIKDLTALESNLNELEKKSKHYTYLINLLTNSKSFIRQGIINQYVSFLNKRINEYSQKLGLPHVSEINSDLTVDIQYMRKSVSYFNLSAGERMRLDISTSIAMRELLGLLGVKSNLLMVDEILDGSVDSSGLKQMFSLLKGYTEHVMLISHRDDFQTMVDRVITITKENGFSKIEHNSGV